MNLSRSNFVGGALRDEVMVVDTDRSSAKAIHRILSENHYPVRCFCNPKRAIGEFTKHPDRYKSVVVTLRMSGMSGFEFIRKVKKITAGAKVILVTDFRMTGIEFSKVFPSCHVDGIVLKPPQGPELLGAIDAVKTEPAVESSMSF